ncbi:hypothetical protein IFM89_001404 [Coptis chinensis]|uniref:SWIM-type domain-containing protein n=1 Tax=Coptis chinensis TaxID=261450 RepID=A0A835LUQ9_9MAGN|nr:hypothetical protein IFM89_001404 [Coptis chinensis]
MMEENVPQSCSSPVYENRIREDIYEPSQLHEIELGEPSVVPDTGYHVAETVVAEAPVLPETKFGELSVSIIGGDSPRTQISEASHVPDTYGVSIVGGETLETQFLEASCVPDTYGSTIVGGETLETQFFEASRVPDTYGVNIVVGETLQNQFVEASLILGTCGAGVYVLSSQHVRERHKSCLPRPDQVRSAYTLIIPDIPTDRVVVNGSLDISGVAETVLVQSSCFGTDESELLNGKATTFNVEQLPSTLRLIIPDIPIDRVIITGLGSKRASLELHSDSEGEGHVSMDVAGTSRIDRDMNPLGPIGMDSKNAKDTYRDDVMDNDCMLEDYGLVYGEFSGSDSPGCVTACFGMARVVYGMESGCHAEEVNGVDCVSVAGERREKSQRYKEVVVDEGRIEDAPPTEWVALDPNLLTIQGSFGQSYQLLNTYSKELMKVDRFSFTKLQIVGNTDRFKCYFWSYGITVRSFRHICRPHTEINGTHLRGRSRGCLISAIAVDGDNHVFPVTFGLVSGEDNENYNWFLCCLGDQVIGYETPLVIISDRHLSLVVKVPEVFPRAKHVFCMNHICKNMSGLTPSLPLMRKIKTAAKTTQEWFFRAVMRDIKKMNSHVYDKLMEIPLDKWACHASIVKRYHVESWNNMIKDDRAIPVVCLVEAIRENLSAHYCKYKKMADDWAARGEWFTPRATGLVRANITKALKFTQSRAGTGEYLIKTDRCRIFHVNLKNRVCSCGYFQHMGIPCAHACKAITVSRQACHMTYVDSYYSTTNCQRCYSEVWVGIPSKEQWDIDEEEERVLPLP